MDQNYNPNAQMFAQGGPQIDAAQTNPVPAANTTQPAPQQTTPAAPSVAQPTPSTSTANLQPGAQGQDVKNLQDYLVQMGYLSPEQVATGSGTYGPQTTAAVTKLQSDLGLHPTTGQGYFGPQTKKALAQQYQQLYQSKKGTTVPQNASDARSAVDTAASAQTTQSNDPVFSAMASAISPIMDSLSQVLNNINNPALTAVSLQKEYNDLAQQYNLPGMNAQLMNMQNIMNGTPDDIRQEVAKAGGTITESQVQAMTAARNNVIMKQYNALATQYQAAQTNVQNMMQYASTDQSTQLQREQMTASVTESMASIEAQMMNMGMTMQQNAATNYRAILTGGGPQALADAVKGDPSKAERALGFDPGTLSNTETVSKMQDEWYKTQQLSINNTRAAIAAFNAGYNLSPQTETTAAPGTPAIGTTPVDPNTLIRPPFVGPNIPLTATADLMDKYMKANPAAQIDPGTNNIIAPGIGYYVQQSDGSYVLKSALPSDVGQQYQKIKQTIDTAGEFKGSPTVTRKWTLAANSAISSFKDTGTYKVISNVKPYLAAIHAAAMNPGDKSVSDFELLDSFVKAAKGGTGQVTDSQVNVMLSGASIPDKWNILEQKLQQGGTLSETQRQALIGIADETYKRNLQDYEGVYVQAIQAMQSQGIPVQFWRNLPDFSSM